LLAPYLPFATEEAWSWWNAGAIHREPWPVARDVVSQIGNVSDADLAKWGYARELLAHVRRRRSEAKQPLKVPIVKAVVADEPTHLLQLDGIEADLKSALRIETIVRSPRPGELAIEVEFDSARP
jgi:valyl-tRNA synthetase